MANETSNKMAQLMAKVAADETLRAQLIATPAAILKAEGIEVPEGLEIKVLENTDAVFHLVLPQNSSELSDEDLDAVAGGFCPIIGC